LLLATQRHPWPTLHQEDKIVISTANKVAIAEMHAFDTPPFPINFCLAMCTFPIVDKEKAAANATLHADIIKEIKNMKADFTKPRVLSTSPSGIFLPGKHAKTVKFHNISSNDNASTASIRSTTNDLSNNTNVDTDMFSLSNLLNSA
jgi:hypothetical protein